MVPAAEIKKLKAFEMLHPATLEALSTDINELVFETDDFILHQHDEARGIYVLLSGSVKFLISIEGMDDLFVGATSHRGALIGWSVVREPYRYTASVKCTEPCRVLHLPRSSLDQIVKQDPRAGRRILEVVAADLVDRLENARELLGRLPKTGPRGES